MVISGQPACRFRGILFGMMLAATEPFAGGSLDPALHAYEPQRQVSSGMSSIGDDTMQPLMVAWLAAFQERQPGIQKGVRWKHLGSATAIGALMFELADVAPLARELWPSELAPYAHQFAGDMMKSPLLIRVAMAGDHPVYIAVNKRPGAPLPSKVQEFLSFVLSRDGQAIVARSESFRPLDAREIAEERIRLEGFVAPLDAAIPSYHPSARVNGAISSVGSDGMKSLMETWMRDFRRQQPGVEKGERWEHLGTLNGFHALIANETMLAPMGRELWPEEAVVYRATGHQAPPLEIRVARGGFNTPQRTTAQAVFVNHQNPLTHITVTQLAAILGQPPTVTRWGQLGLTGEWADRLISICIPPKIAPNAMSIQVMVLHGGAWSGTAREGSIAETAAAIAHDPGALGFGGFEEGGPGLKALAVAATDTGPYYEGTAANTSSGRYPLTRYMYIRLNRQPDEPLSPQVKEFLRYVLSREGQEPILFSGYFPLNADEVRQELVKLE